MNRSELGAALREASGKEAEAVARSAVMSASKLSKIETGKLSPSTDDVDRVLPSLGVSDAVKEEYTDAARAVATEPTAWRLIQRAGLDKAPRHLREIEARTSLLRVVQPAWVPGLLQTPEYAGGAIPAPRPCGGDGATHAECPTRTAGSPVLRRPVVQLRDHGEGPHVGDRAAALLAGQIDRLATACRLPAPGSRYRDPVRGAACWCRSPWPCPCCPVQTSPTPYVGVP